MTDKKNKALKALDETREKVLNNEGNLMALSKELKKLLKEVELAINGKDVE